MKLPERIEEFLLRFEAIAPAADWRLGSGGEIETPRPAVPIPRGAAAFVEEVEADSDPDGPPCPLYYAPLCPLHYAAGLSWRNTTLARLALGLDPVDCREIWQAADNLSNGSPFIRRRLLAATGLGERTA